jgi:proline iminopeptidase
MRTPLLVLALGLLSTSCLCASDPGNLVPKTVAEDPSLPAIDLAGTRFHAEAYGDPGAPVLLVLHGGPGGDYRNLLPLKDLAGDGYRVVFWDQRGAGLSKRQDPGTIDTGVYIEDLRQIIEYYAPTQPIVFIGHSWGAMYATAFINQYGDLGGRIRGAILSEPGAFTDRQLRDFLKRYQAAISLVGERFNDALWSEQFVSAADHERADFQAMQFRMLGVPSEHDDPAKPSPRWRFGAFVSSRLLHVGQTEGFDWTTHLSAFQHEVLFLRGDKNEAATLEQQQELAASYPDATIETIPNVGHEMIWERSAEYLAHTRAYLARIGVAP